MLDMILRFSTPHFYGEKVSGLGDAVRKYVEAKGASAGDDAIRDAKSRAEELCSSLMTESGFADRNASYISIDKEFIAQDGGLDEKRLARFQKEIVKHFSTEQLKWSFAGTTGAFTQITKSALASSGRRYEDLLPGMLRDQEESKRENKRKPSRKAGYSAFLYPDGSVSEKIVPEKLKVRFDILSDAHGFDWKRGYSPDNSVVKKEWISGFNKDGVWEKLHTVPEKSTTPRSTNIEASFLKGAGKTEDDSIRVAVYESGAIIFDNQSRLYKDTEETFYSISGELYGARRVDREKSLARLHAYLTANKVKRLEAVVLSDPAKGTIDFYKNAFADFVDGKTSFAAPGDETLTSKIERLGKTGEEKSVSGAVLERFFSLCEKGVKGEELYAGFEPGNTSGIEEVPLNIFQSPEDLDTFLVSPSVVDVCDPEVVMYLRELTVPKEKQAALSNAAQAIVHNYKRLFRHVPVSQIDVMRAAEDLIVRNHPTKLAGDTRLVAEKTFGELVLEGAGIHPAEKRDLFFTPSNEKAEEAFRRGDADIDAWMDSALAPMLTPETLVAIKTEYKKTVVPEDMRKEFSLAVTRVLPNLKSIVESTGMKPAEIIGNIVRVLRRKQGESPLVEKRIFFEKSLRDFIIEASGKNLYKVKREKKTLSSGQKAALVWKPFDGDLDLSDEKDLDSFLSSPFLKESGFTVEEASRIATFIRSSAKSASDKTGFSEGLLNVLRGYGYRIKPRGITIETALDSYRSLFSPAEEKGGAKTQETLRIRDIVHSVSNVRQKGVSGEAVYDRKAAIVLPSVFDAGMLDTLLSNGLVSILDSSGVAGLNLPKEQAEEVFRYLTKLRIPKEKRSFVLENVAAVLRNYENTFAPERVKALDAVEAAATITRAKKNKKPSRVEQVVRNLIATGSRENRTDKSTEEDARSSYEAKKRRFHTIVSEEGFKRFIASKEFASSGLDANQFKKIVERYVEAFEKKSRVSRNIDIVPFVYTDAPIPAEIEETNTNMHGDPVFVSQGPQANTDHVQQGIENNVYNLGWIVKTGDKRTHSIAYTKQGNRMIQSGRPGKSATFTGVRNNSILVQDEGKTGRTLLNEALVGEQAGTFDRIAEVPESVIIDFPQDMIPESIDGMKAQKESETTFPFMFANSQTTSKYAKSSESFVQPNKRSGRETSFPGTTKQQANTGNLGQDNLVTNNESNRIRRIEENYNRDKRMLARSATANPLTGSSQAEGKGGNDEGNIVQQLSDDLLDEMKHKTLEEGF